MELLPRRKSLVKWTRRVLAIWMAAFFVLALAYSPLSPFSDIQRARAVDNVDIIVQGTTTWQVPADWSDVNTIHAIGAGGDGRTSSAGEGGGGGGGYATVSNVTGLTAGNNVTVQVGVGGGTQGTTGATWFNGADCAGASVCATGGITATAAAGAAGGANSVGSGSAGGTGGTGQNNGDTGGGGGGAAGPGGAGKNGGNSVAGAGSGGGGGGGSNAGSATNGSAGNTAVGGNGGAGSAGTGGGTFGNASNGNAGSNGGGGGGGDTSFSGGPGGAGIVTWTDSGNSATAGPGGGGGGGGNNNGGPDVGGDGGNYGGGGGGGEGGAGQGANGILVITYTPAVATITISGTCKQNDQSTDCTDTGTIKVAVNGSLQAQTQATVAGTWTISAVTQPGASGDVVTVFIDGVVSSEDRAVAVTKWVSGNITGMELIEGRLSIGSADNQNISNTNLSQYDNSASGDADVFYDVDGSTALWVDSNDSVTDDELYIKTGNTYSPAGNFKAKHMENNGTLTGTSGNTYTFFGNWDDNGTYTPGSSTVQATGTAAVISSNDTFDNLTIDPITAGTVTVQDTSFSVAATLNIASGDTLSINSGLTATTTSASTLTLNGTIGGAGLLAYQKTTAFPTTGTISSKLRFDANGAAGNQIASARTYGGDVEAYNSGGTARTLTLGTAGSQTLTFSGNFTVEASGTTNMTVAGNTWDPVVNITGNVDFTGTGSGTEIIDASDDGTAIWDINGNLDISSGTFSAPRSATLKIGGNYTNTGGTFNDESGYVQFDATATGKTISGTLDGTSQFSKMIFDGSGGGWTIQDPILVASTTNDALVLKNGTVTLGDGNGDNLDLRGKMKIATSTGETATFQTAAVAEGFTITIDLNNNSGAQASCPDCLIVIGDTAGGTGSFKLAKNTILRLNPNDSGDAGTDSDTGIVVESTGYLEILGSQAQTGTIAGLTQGTASSTLIVSGTPWSADAYNNMVVRITNTDSPAFGMIYTINDTTANSISITATTTSTDISPIIEGAPTACSGSASCVVQLDNTILTKTEQHIGRFLHNKNDDKYYRIASSTDSTVDSVEIVSSPDAFTDLEETDTLGVEITDGFRANDTFEILDYAHVTAENGTACTASMGGEGEAYIRAKAGSETVIRYAEICNLGRPDAEKLGIVVESVNGSNSNEGFTIDKSHLKNNRRSLFLNGFSNNNGTKGVLNNFIETSFNTGIHFNGDADNNLVSGNRVLRDAGEYGIYLPGGSDGNTITGNYVYRNPGHGIWLQAAQYNTITDNFVYLNGTVTDANGHHGILIEDGSPNNVVIGNTIFKNKTWGLVFRDPNTSNNTAGYNTLYRNIASGIVGAWGGDYNTYYKNTSHSNGTHGETLGCSVTMTGNLLFGNSFYSNTQIGFVQEGGQGGGGTCNKTIAINESYGVLGTNPSSDYNVNPAGGTDVGPHQIFFYNSTFGSPTETTFTGPFQSTRPFVFSRKHDGTAGLTKIWMDYVIPDENTETPQTEATNKFNYADNLWEKSVSPHGYFGTGTQDADIAYDISSATLTSGPYHYRVKVKTANATCASVVFDVFRASTSTLIDVGDANGCTQFTDSYQSVNLKFTIEQGATQYVVGDTYTFTAWDVSGDTNTAKDINMMQDADTVVVGANRTLELKGQSAGTNVTEVTNGGSGGYQFSILQGGTIDANAYSFNYLGGTGQPYGLMLKDLSTVTDLNNGTFDNFAINNSTADSYIAASSTLIGSQNASKAFNGMTFNNATGFANCNVNATGTDASGYWAFFSVSGTMNLESNACNDGVTDGTPGQIYIYIRTPPNPSQGGSQGGSGGGAPQSGGGQSGGGGGSQGGSGGGAPQGGGGQGGGGGGSP